MPAIRIVDWTRHYESSESRKVQRLAWVKVPNRHDGTSYCELMEHPDGLQHLGAWLLILQVASKMPERGLLIDERGRELSDADIARRTRCPQEAISAAIPVLIEAGWVEYDAASGCRADFSGGHPDFSGGAPDFSALEERREEKRRAEQSKTRAHTREADAADDPMADAMSQIEEDPSQRALLPAPVRSLPDWFFEHGRAFRRDNRDEWEAAFRRLGWDLMSEAYQVACETKDARRPPERGKKPAPIFIDEISELIEGGDE